MCAVGSRAPLLSTYWAGGLWGFGLGGDPRRVFCPEPKLGKSFFNIRTALSCDFCSHHWPKKIGAPRIPKQGRTKLASDVAARKETTPEGTIYFKLGLRAIIQYTLYYIQLSRVYRDHHAPTANPNHHAAHHQASPHIHDGMSCLRGKLHVLTLRVTGLVICPV